MAGQTKVKTSSKINKDKKNGPAKTTKANKTVNTPGNEKASKKPEDFIPDENDKKLKNEIMLLIALACTLLVLMSNFGFLSPLGDYISYFLFGIFGIISYILPIGVFLGVAFLISNIDNPKVKKKFLAGCILLILICSMIQLIFIGYDENVSAFKYYFICGKNKSGGGLAGAIVVKVFGSIIGVIGTYIILLLGIIITMVIMTEKSFISSVKKSSRKVYSQARKDAGKIRENVSEYVDEKTYEKKKKRINNKVKGVAIQKISQGEANEDIHEITGDFTGKIPENAHLYRGHIDVDKYVSASGSDSSGVSDSRNDGYNDVPDDGISYNNDTDYEAAYMDYMKDTQADDGEEQKYADSEPAKTDYVKTDYAKTEEKKEDILDFQPKEKIVVSQEAKNIMNRKAFSTSPVVKTQGNGTYEKARADISDTAEIKTADKLSDAGTVKVKSPKKRNYILPKTNLLTKGNVVQNKGNDLELRETANHLERILATFGVTAEVTEYHRGPSVTRYEILPEIGTRLANITKLADDIKLNLAATDIRIEPIPGKSTVGIEVPNENRDSVLIRDLIESKELRNHPSKIAFAAGKDIAGNVIVGDIAKMPHMLIAGTTGSGKSVFTNSIIMSILFRAKPSEVRLIIVDPKVVEFGVYNGIPHLLQPVVTDPRLASNTLKWAVAEMSDRYKKFADMNVRDLKGYNDKLDSMAGSGDEKPEKLPQIVIVIDELADLMMVAAKEVEESICRLAQLARAAGIHLIIATQRPSVNVVTGLIKANIPSRTALMVSSGVDSRTIIDQNGAEKLLGNGDMLFYPSGYVKPVRLQGAFVSDAEVQRVVEFWKSQAGEADYDESISRYVEQSQTLPGQPQSDDKDDDGRDEYFYEAARFVVEKQKASTSMLQRIFKIGFNRAARIMDQMCEAGIVGEEEGTKPRKVLIEDVKQLENI